MSLLCNRQNNHYYVRIFTRKKMSKTFHIAEEQKLALMKFNTLVGLKKPDGKSGVDVYQWYSIWHLFTTQVRSTDRWTSIFL